MVSVKKAMKAVGLFAMSLVIGGAIAPSAHAAAALTYSSADMGGVVTEVTALFAGYFPTILVLFAIGLALRFGRRLLNLFHI